MNFERSDTQSFLLTSFSALILALGLFIFYYFRGEAGFEDSFVHLANLKSYIEKGELRTFHEPISFLLLLFCHKLFRINYMNAYHLSLAFTLSIFLHLVMICIREKTWKVNHYFLIYLSAFLPFTLYLPYYFQEEFLCLIFLFALQARFKLDSLKDLFKLIIYFLFAFFSSIYMFLFGSLVFVGWNVSQKMKEKKTTVFFKKKNIPLRIFFGYFVFFVLCLSFIWLTDFYGDKSIRFLFNSYWNIISQMFPVFLVLFLGEYLLRSEKELNTRGTTIIVIILILSSVYYTYKSSYENIQFFKVYEQEILYLKSRGKISLEKNKILAPKVFGDYMYYTVGEQLLNSYLDMKSTDFMLVSKVDNAFVAYLDKHSLNNSSYYIIGEDTILISKNLIEKIVESPIESQPKTRLLSEIQKYSASPLLVSRFNRILCGILGL